MGRTKRFSLKVQSLYGDLVIADEQYGGARGRRWRVEWTETPQPIQVKINCIRGLKDKIPVGRYSLMVSLYDRIGGHPMQWSNLDGSRWGTATLPVAHSGKYFNSELKIDQSVFTVAPSKDQLKSFPVNFRSTFGKLPVNFRLASFLTFERQN